MRAEFRRDLAFHESFFVGQEFVIQDQGQLEQEHIAADECLAVERAVRLVDFPYLNTESGGEPAGEVKHGPGEAGKLIGMCGSAGGKHDFASDDDIGALGFLIALINGTLTADDADGGGGGGGCTKAVADHAEIDSKIAPLFLGFQLRKWRGLLSIGRKSGPKKYADEQTAGLAGLDHEFPSPVGKSVHSRAQTAHLWRVYSDGGRWAVNNFLLDAALRRAAPCAPEWISGPEGLVALPGIEPGFED
jgi:hypothetical protein